MPIAQSSLGGKFWTGLRTLATNRRWPIFLAVMFVGGMGSATVHNFLFPYLADLAGVG